MSRGKRGAGICWSSDSGDGRVSPPFPIPASHIADSKNVRARSIFVRQMVKLMLLDFRSELDYARIGRVSVLHIALCLVS